MGFINGSPEGLFKDMTSLESVDLSEVHFGPAYPDCTEMFSGCTALRNVKIFDTGGAYADSLHGSRMFYCCGLLEEIDLSGIKTTGVDCEEMFSGCSSLRIPIM
ncbi:MAG: leucine-rich repeat domain-containing protein [Lachnospiraceae bacterium]|nr:leucine-rich repeat domain-containing protein [Lachnospiraceae bacterium]